MNLSSLFGNRPRFPLLSVEMSTVDEIGKIDTPKLSVTGNVEF